MIMEKKAGFILLLLTRAVVASADSEIICSSEPVEAAVSKNVTLQCHLVPPLDATNMTVKWRHESKNQTVLLTQDGHTSLFPEELTKGNLSLKISSVQLSDSGRYRCSVTSENLQHSCYVNLTVVPAGDIHTEQITDSSQTTDSTLIIGITVAVAIVLVIVFALGWCRCKGECDGDGCLELSLGICECVCGILLEAANDS